MLVGTELEAGSVDDGERLAQLKNGSASLEQATVSWLPLPDLIEGQGVRRTLAFVVSHMIRAMLPRW